MRAVIPCDPAPPLPIEEVWFESGHREPGPRLVGAAKMGLPATNPCAGVTPESAEFRLCRVPIVEASESPAGPGFLL